MEIDRPRRVAELIQRELARLISTQMNDPRLKMLTVTGVDLTRDLKLARVYVSRYGERPSMKDALAGLARARGYLRRELGRTLKLRFTPDLEFVEDQSIERGVRLSRLIDQSVASDRSDTPSS